MQCVVVSLCVGMDRVLVFRADVVLFVMTDYCAVGLVYCGSLG